MGKQRFTNNASALITSNITPSSLSFTIEAAFADKYPALVAGDWFIGTLQSSAGDVEVIKVNKRDVGSNAIQNVERAQEGTTALSLSAGEAIFSVRPTASLLQAVSDHLVDPEDAHAASAISFAPTADIDATNTQAALQQAYDKLTTAIALASSLLGSSKVSITDLIAQTHTQFTTTGVSPDYVLTPTPAITAYGRQRYQIKVHANGASDACTVNISGLGPKALKRYDAAGNKVPCRVFEGQLIDVVYDGMDLVVLNAPVIMEAPGDVNFTLTPTQAPGTRRILIQGQCIQLALYPTLTFLWCGSALNNNADPNLKADFFYKCADPANPNGTRSDLGGYLKLPDPGYYFRTLNTGTTGLDAGRSPFKYQEQQLMDHEHTSPISALDGPALDAANGRGGGIDGHFKTDNISLKTGMVGTIGTELRVKGRGLYEWMSY